MSRIVLPTNVRVPEPEEEMIGFAVREYLAERIGVDELERAIEHALRGGLGNAEFPYLPAFPRPMPDSLVAVRG